MAPTDGPNIFRKLKPHPQAICAQSRLCDAVARMSTDDLQTPVPGKQLTKHEEILGVLNHTVYHSGQISLLKKS